MLSLNSREDLGRAKGLFFFVYFRLTIMEGGVLFLDGKCCKLRNVNGGDDEVNIF